MNIHATAVVSNKAVIGDDVKIGPFTIIHENVEISKNTVIEGFCEIGVSNHLSNGKKLYIGANSYIRSHSIFYEGSIFLESLVTGHRVTVRENIKAGKNFQIGTLSDLQGHSEIGDYVRLHSNVHIGQNSKIGNFVFVYPYVVFTNDPTPPSDVCIGPIVEDYAQIATMSVLLPGIRVGRHALVGAGAVISKDVKDYSLAVGNPGRHIKDVRDIKSQVSQDSHYPWPNHFSRGMPWSEEGYEAWSRK